VRRLKPVQEWLEEDLALIVAANEKENVSIDYKSSEALNFDDRTARTKGAATLGEKHRQELIRDVVAMANAEGGLIIYGIKEETGGYPASVDSGYDSYKTSADRITQILVNNIHPRLQEFSIHPIELKSKGAGLCAFVLSIAKASSHAPHQADDKLYYKRHEATRMVMDDYEIRDRMRRSIQLGRRYSVAWEFLQEARRLEQLMIDQNRIDASLLIPRDSLSVTVSSSLRSDRAPGRGVIERVRQD
jgi:hypothetical protein